MNIGISATYCNFFALFISDYRTTVVLEFNYFIRNFSQNLRTNIFISFFYFTLSYD